MVNLGMIPKTMANIHPTSILDGDITIAEDAIIGPNCVLEGDIVIGSGCHLIGNVFLTGKLEMGSENVVYPFSCIGFAAQDINFSADKYEPGIVIGNNNTFREGTTVHRATQELPTTIGDHNIFMTTSHVGHDCQVANYVTMVTNTALGGHVQVQDRVLVGGASSVHQFVTIGSGAMLAAGLITTYDVLPYFLLTGYNIVGSINIIGMRRIGMSSEEITKRKDIYKLLYRSEHSMGKAIEILRSKKDMIAQEYINAIDTSRRGIVPRSFEKRTERRSSVVEVD